MIRSTQTLWLIASFDGWPEAPAFARLVDTPRTVIIKRAVDNGLTEVRVGRFPNRLCTDKSRAINQQEPGWEATLTGLPKELFFSWQKHLQPRGYKLKYEIVDFADGMPGDIGITLSWK